MTAARALSMVEEQNDLSEEAPYDPPDSPIVAGREASCQTPELVVRRSPSKRVWRVPQTDSQSAYTVLSLIR
jgi:hypothetical protein